MMINIRKLENDLWESADLLRAGSKLTSNHGYIKFCKLSPGRPGRVLIDRKSLKRYLASKVVHDPHKRIRETPMKGARYRVN